MTVASSPGGEPRTITVAVDDYRTWRARLARLPAMLRTAAVRIAAASALVAALLVGLTYLVYGLGESTPPLGVQIGAAASALVLMLVSFLVRIAVLGNTANLRWARSLRCLIFQPDRILEVPHDGPPVSHRYSWVYAVRPRGDRVWLTVAGSELAPNLSRPLRVVLRLHALDERTRAELFSWLRGHLEHPLARGSPRRG